MLKRINVLIATFLVFILATLPIFIFAFFSGLNEKSFLPADESEWPMFHHDVSRKGFTNVTGNITSPSVRWNLPITSFIWSSPAISDIDNDGDKEVVIGSDDRNVYALNGVNGAEEWHFTTNGLVHSSPAISDIDNDGDKEVVIGSDDGNVYALNGVNGAEEWHFTTNSSIRSSPAISDIDNDGDKEVVIGSDDGNVYALNGVNGAEEWHFTTNGVIQSSPAISDIDNDGDKEVVIGSNDGNVYALNGVNGAEEWHLTTNASILTAPAISDIDNDGDKEILVTTTTPAGVFCLNYNGGVTWNISLDASIYSSPAIGDLDGNGYGEIVFGDFNGTLYCLDYMGGENWIFYGQERIIPSPAIADINNDGFLEVLIGDHVGFIYALNGTDGSVVWQIDEFDDIHSSPAVGDIDNDGEAEIVFATMDGHVIAIDSPPFLQIEKDDSPDSVEVGDEIHYTIYYSNDGGMPSTNTTITDIIPSECSYIDATPPPDFILNNTLIWNIGTLMEKENGTILLNVRVDYPPDNGVNYTNYVSITCEQNISDYDFEITNYTIINADLFLYKDDTPDPVYTGGWLTYILYVGNDGQDTAYNVTVTDILPQGVTYIVAVPPPSSTNPLIWNFGDRADGWSQYIYIYVLVEKTEGSIMNYANITSDTSDLNQANNEDWESTNITPLADLSITKSDNPDPVDPGEYLEYTLTVTNNGPSNASNVVIKDTLSNKVTFNYAIPPPDGHSGNVYYWQAGSMLAGDSRNITINVTVNSGVAGTILNIANVTSDTPDLNQANNEDEEITHTQEEADLQITKSDMPDPVIAGNYLEYTLTITNLGPSDAENVVVYDTLPSGVSLNYAIPSASGSYPTYHWNLGTISAGDSEIITINVSVASDTSGIIY
ncbi:MAG TPA: DUF11 domain-containing protein, partial [Thermoplasmatales archaeon]|nr:DUF11 domain-containing protein [Thermoplasmatales archaeon]